jgi:hypothetical protein
MPRHNFRALFNQYPDVIAQMPAAFTSHEFILRLAQENQALYVKALYSYRNETAPFKIVHGILARHLHAFKPAVRRIGKAQSVDIFGKSQECAKWRRA